MYPKDKVRDPDGKDRTQHPTVFLYLVFVSGVDLRVQKLGTAKTSISKVDFNGTGTTWLVIGLLPYLNLDWENQLYCSDRLGIRYWNVCMEFNLGREHRSMFEVIFTQIETIH